MKYCQYDEEVFLLNHFGDKKGFLVDIGAADGIRNSNSRKLIEKGWRGLLVEPGEVNFKKLTDIYSSNDRIILENCGCSYENKDAIFYHDYNDDAHQISTFSVNQKDICLELYSCEFVEKTVKLVKTMDLLKKHNISKIDFMSIDTESYDENVLLGLEFNKIDIELICVERDSDILKKNGYKKIHSNAGNIFYKK
jgi:FkbM family methyltransferase